jgi:hypothetical protein
MFNANFEKKHAAMVDESIKRQGKRAQHATDTCRTACNARGLPHLQVRPCKASGRAISDRPGDSPGSLATPQPPCRWTCLPRSLARAALHHPRRGPPRRSKARALLYEHSMNTVRMCT